ncbi:MAG: phage tail protein [Acidobacteria bacterium]|nr:phage tail protein [Acidobacteriota bacterium]MBI3424459.1 phage tail protein [Acidobacteriota bacterium]
MHFLGEIRMFASDFAPSGWAFCNGQSLPIAQYQSLFMVIGTTYGGDGITTFALPNLPATVPVGAGQGSGLSNRTLGQRGGQAAVALTVQQMPQHSHLAASSEAKGNQKSPAGRVWAATADGAPAYSNAAPNAQMKADALAFAGAGKPHNNLSPYQCVGFVIALEGQFPARS